MIRILIRVVTKVRMKVKMKSGQELVHRGRRGNGLKAEGAASLARQGLQPLKSDLAFNIDAAQGNCVGCGRKGNMDLGNAGCDRYMLIMGGADFAVARVNDNAVAGESGIGTNLGTVCHALGSTGVPHAK